MALPLSKGLDTDHLRSIQATQHSHTKPKFKVLQFISRAGNRKVLVIGWQLASATIPLLRILLRVTHLSWPVVCRAAAGSQHDQ
jgi:hypothetical protein